MPSRAGLPLDTLAMAGSHGSEKSADRSNELVCSLKYGTQLTFGGCHRGGVAEKRGRRITLLPPICNPEKAALGKKPF